MTQDFQSMAVRLRDELLERQAMAARALQFHIGFFDDCLRAILPHDLVLIGAPSGVGKTDLALNIATSNAWNGKRVHYFALEAEPRELERRTKFSMLSRCLFQSQHPQANEFNYADWMLGKCEHMCRLFNAECDAKIAAQLAPLKTFYRGAHFDAEDLARKVLENHEQTDLLIIDHLHYVDNDERDEHRGLADTVKTIRDVSLRIGKPIVLVAHLRKRDQRGRQATATLDDFHGSSNIVKICTQAIALDPATDIESPKWYLAPTYISVLKDRRAGAPRLVAVVDFDRRTRHYREHYSLGRIEGGAWVELQTGSQPSWAKRFKTRNA